MAEALTHARIFRFWFPLSLTWAIMGIEIPIISAAVAGLSDPVENLAALGVAIAIAWFSETLAVNLTAASLRLGQDGASYLVVRRYGYILCGIALAINVLIVVTPVLEGFLSQVLGMTDTLSERTAAAYVWLAPWPAVIGLRRLYQGQLIRHGLSRLVACGTGVRLLFLTSGALVASLSGILPGAEAGAACLTLAVIAEAIAARIMASGAIRRTLAATSDEPPPTVAAFWQFYWPLTVMMGLNLSVSAFVTAGIAKAEDATIALAAFPLAHGLNFVARAVTTSYQEVAIALLGESDSNSAKLKAFAHRLGGAVTVILALIAFTPAASWLFKTLMDVPAPLTGPVVEGFMALLLYPGVTLWFMWSRARLTHVRHTRPIAFATVIETVVLVALLALFVGPCAMAGATAAGLAMVGSRIIANIWLERAVAVAFQGGPR